MCMSTLETMNCPWVIQWHWVSAPSLLSLPLVDLSSGAFFAFLSVLLNGSSVLHTTYPCVYLLPFFWCYLASCPQVRFWAVLKASLSAWAVQITMFFFVGFFGFFFALQRSLKASCWLSHQACVPAYSQMSRDMKYTPLHHTTKA